MRVTPLFLAAGICLLSGAAFGQTSLPVERALQPRFAGTYKMATGEFLPASHGARSGPEVIFNNMTPTNYYGIPGSGQEWIDEGGLLDRGGEYLDQINGFEYVYCSTDPAPTGSTTISFYRMEGICTGPIAGGAPDGADCSYQITGLPLGTPSGGLQCWIVNVDLTGGLECPSDQAYGFPTEDAANINRHFGWGFLTASANTGPWIRKGGHRTDNSFVWWDTNSQTNIGCYWFGGTPFASFAMKMFGGPAGSFRYWPDTPGPKDTLVLSSSEIVPGHSGTWQVTPVSGGHTYWLIGSPDWNQISTLGGTVLFAYPAILPPTPLQMPGGVLTVPVPNVFPDQVWVQSVETIGPLAPANITAFSNSIVHLDTKAPARMCEVLTFDVPKNRSGCKTVAVGGGRKKVGEEFQMVATFGATNPECCEYRQYIKGEFMFNGAPLPHNLPGKKKLEKDTFHEDGVTAPSATVNEHYGHRDEGSMDPTDQYTNPNRAMGKNYDGSDFPGITGTPPYTYDIKLTFLGEIIDVCNGNKEVKCAIWTVKCNGMVTMEADAVRTVKDLDLEIDGMPVTVRLVTHTSPRVTIVVSFPNGDGSQAVDASAVDLQVQGMSPVKSPSGWLVQTELMGATVHAIYEYDGSALVPDQALQGTVSVLGSQPVPVTLRR